MTRHDIVLECRGVCHSFGPKHVLHDINMRIIGGEVVALVGPSGCGKSTLLRAIVGTHPPRRGQVLVRQMPGGQPVLVPVTRPGRDRGIVYQRYSLFPNLTALQNVAFGLMLDQTTIPQRLFRFARWRNLRKTQLAQARALLERLGLAQAMSNYPHELSGGMCQRVAIAQALIMKPTVLLLDEPFGALDEATREDLQRMLLSLYAENVEARRKGASPPYTILIVTHEINEAIYVSDRVMGLSQFWNWREKHEAFPGATIVYDDVAPVFNPEDERDYATFRNQKNDILRAAFDPQDCHAREEWQRFWSHVQTGCGQGVLRT